MTDLLVFVFSDAKQAELSRDLMLSLEKQDLATIEDAVVVVRSADGAITLTNSHKQLRSGEREQQPVVIPLLPRRAL
jgi:uncharacterized membrane protein